MKRIGKFVAVLAGIALFVMPAATMPLHCIFKAPSGGNTHPCHMMGMDSSADQINAASLNHSCCQVSAAKPEAVTVPQSPAGKGIAAPPTTNAFLSDPPVAPVLREPFDWTAPASGGPPQAVLCTFLI